MKLLLQSMILAVVAVGLSACNDDKPKKGEEHYHGDGHDHSGENLKHHKGDGHKHE